MLERTTLVLGQENMQKIQNCNIIIFGVGGVGGYVAEMLIRLGVEKLTVVDCDNVDKTNLNRQIVALNSTLNKSKVEVFKNRAKDINPGCSVVAINKRLDGDCIQDFFNVKYDYVIDAIDDVSAKVALAKFCYNSNINLISSMGTGNRYKGIPCFEVCDIYKTSYDKLAKKIRSLLKKEGVKKLTVAYTKQSPEKTEKLGSVVYYPLMCAGTIVSFVINKLLE